MQSSPEFSHELSLLVLCLRQTTDPAQSDTLRQHLSNPLDWTKMMVLAERHRLVPHLYLALKNSAADLVPLDAWEIIRDRFRINAARNVQLMSELVRIIRSLEQADIPALPLKGPALALQLYGGLECRQFNDLDLVVPPDRVVRAAEIIRAMDYHGPATLLPDLTPRQQQRTLARYKDASFFKSQGTARILLELHWDLADGFAIPAGWEHAATAQIGVNHGPLRALPSRELTLFLAHHGACHMFFRLSWLADLLRAVESLSPAEWETLSEQSLAFRCQRHYVLGLTVLSRLGLLSRNPLPEAIRTIGQTMRGLERLVEGVFQAIAAPRDWSQHPLRRYPWIFRLGGWRDGVQSLTTTISPQPDDAFGRGDLSAHWHRWCRVFAKYVIQSRVCR